MPKFTYKEGLVTISYTPPVGKQEMEATESKLFNNRFMAKGWKDVKPELKTRFTNIITTAPQMVRTAIAALETYEALVRARLQQAEMTIRDEVWFGLAKYFAIVDWENGSYWAKVHGIKLTFEAMEKGLTGEYQIELRLPGEGAMGDAYAGVCTAAQK